MAVTILESLRNANYNLKDPVGSSTIGVIIAKLQLNNAVILLEKGYDLNDEVEPLLERYGNVKDVPLKDIAK